jgi:hypothetical protein
MHVCYLVCAHVRGLEPFVPSHSLSLILNDAERQVIQTFLLLLLLLLPGRLFTCLESVLSNVAAPGQSLQTIERPLIFFIIRSPPIIMFQLGVVSSLA